jgi:hypothetical protein
MVSIYETWLQFDMKNAWRIVARRNKRVDELVLSSKDNLPTLEEEFDRVEMWEKFMVDKAEGHIPQPRDATSGNYEVHNLRDRLKDAARSLRPLEEDGLRDYVLRTLATNGSLVTLVFFGAGRGPLAQIVRPLPAAQLTILTFMIFRYWHIFIPLLGQSKSQVPYA